MIWQKIQQEIEAVPGNGPALGALCDLLETGEAIALVGAGASAGLWPLWDEFLQGFIEHTRQYGKLNSAEAGFLQKEAHQTPLETVQQLRNKIGDNLYYKYVHKTFSDKISPQTGHAFTLTQQALLQLPIQNYLTLNYDAGLTNARVHLYPRATASYYFWDQEQAKNILDHKGFKRQILYAHGRYDRPDSLILTLDDYREAYSYTPFVRLLNHLFNFKNLIMAGFNWRDPYIKQLFDNISGNYKDSLRRHVAFVGLDEEKMELTALYRERVEMLYGARIIFYPSRNNHEILAAWLNTLALVYASTRGSMSAGEIQPIKVSSPAKTLSDRYVHEPTDDDIFEGREEDFAALNRWGNDPATRIIAVTGIGGQGKTSLIGRWLKRMRESELARMPVFYWSFYEDLDVGKFLEEIVHFLEPIVHYIDAKREPHLVSFLLGAARQFRILVVLDGLEVLQEEAGGLVHGRILDPLLQQLLQQWVHHKHQSLMILTSRFAFPQLSHYSGALFHHLSLLRLNSRCGVSLLKKLGLRGDKALLTEYVEKLYGHPLALRVLAAAVKRFCDGDLGRFGGEHILTADSKDELSQKLEHTLGFYERQLENGQKELLGIISLFKRPVDTSNLIILLGRMKSLKHTPLAGADGVAIREQIKVLTNDSLVMETKEGLTCHPVIRDYFRNRLKLSGSRREVADFLQTRPGERKPQNIEEVRDLVEAVQLLCEEGEVKTAHDLHITRLATGGYEFNVFKDIPAPVEGLDASLAFAGDEARQKKTEAALGKQMLAAYISAVSLYNYHLGNLVQAREWRYKALEIYRSLQKKRTQAFILSKISEIENALGNIEQACKTVSQALALLKNSGQYEVFISAFANDGYYDYLLGDTPVAYRSFALAVLCERKLTFTTDYLSAEDGNRQAEVFLRLNDRKRFEEANAWNIEKCKENHWNVALALCHLLQGWYEIGIDRLSQAKKSLLQADRILRPAKLPRELSRLEWVWGLLAEAKKDYKEGLRRVEEALLICEDKGFRLQQADALCLQGRLLLLKFKQEGERDDELLEKAGDSGHKALKIAEDSGYIWAKIAALDLLYSHHKVKVSLLTYDADSERELAQRYLREAEAERSGLLTVSEEEFQGIKAETLKIFDDQVLAGKK